MKLSEKGLKRLHDEAVTYENDGEVVCHPINQSAVVALQNFDFECKDFEDGVVYSKEEVKLIFDTIDNFFEMKLPTDKDINALNQLKFRAYKVFGDVFGF